jgi:hypothetical protein
MLDAAHGIASDLTSNTPVLLSDEPNYKGVFNRIQAPDTMSGKYIFQPLLHEQQRAEEEGRAANNAKGGVDKTGHDLLGIVHGTSSYVPVLGPIIGSLTDRAAGGDIAGSIGEGATYAVAPKITKGVAGKFGWSTRLSSPRSELELTARSSTAVG